MRIAALAVLVLWAGLPLAAQRPLPDPARFLPLVKARLQTDPERQYGYMYVETRRRTTLDGRGRATGVSTRVIESYPGFPGDYRWERVIEDDGRPVPEAELRRKDLDRQRQAEAWARRDAARTPADRAKQEREWETQRRALAESVEDVFRVYDIAMLGRDTIDGHETVVVSLTPRRNARVRTDDGKWLRHFKGRAWISESEYELVRLEVEAIDDVSLALGFLARVHKGTTARFERRKVNGETWLPSRLTYTMSARVLLLKRLRARGESEYARYRKFDVATDTVIADPSAGH